MAFRRRRKPRVLWLPVQGQNLDEGPEATNSSVNGFAGQTLTLQPNGTLVFDAVPVTFDYSDPASFEQGSFDRSLQDLTSGNAYRLRRLVGKIFVGCTTTANAGGIGPVDVAAGFMVNKTDDSGNILQFNSLLGGEDAQRSPLGQDAAEDPWIWRRRWLLSPVSSINSYASAAGIADFDDINETLNGPTYPQTNCHYGSAVDGPHIDQKTARVISRQERLFFWISARQQSVNAGGQNLLVTWTLDLRILASLRMQQGNRRNASR